MRWACVYHEPCVRTGKRRQWILHRCHTMPGCINSSSDGQPQHIRKPLLNSCSNCHLRSARCSKPPLWLVTLSGTVPCKSAVTYHIESGVLVLGCPQVLMTCMSLSSSWSKTPHADDSVCMSLRELTLRRQLPKKLAQASTAGTEGQVAKSVPQTFCVFAAVHAAAGAGSSSTSCCQP